jgi:hypothetical protein
MKSDLNLLQSMTTLVVDVTSLASTSLVRVDVVDVADTSSRQHHELLPEINIRKVSYVHRIYFEIAFFPKTDKFKSAFKLLLTSPGRKLWPILVLLYFQVKLI